MDIRSNTKQNFASYCDYVISLKEQRVIKHSTIVSYKELTSRIYPEIGHIKLKDLRLLNLNELYTALSADGLNKRTKGKLSNKTIVEYHRLISTVLEQAGKEELIPFNIVHRAQPPKLEKKDVNYFQPEQIQAIRKALNNESVKWKTLVYLFLITGASQGEILGLKWDKVDFEGCVIHICNNVLYSSKRGIYEDTPKTSKSKRTISIPIETVNLLKQYKKYQMKERVRLGSYYNNQNFVFAQDNGNPLHPDSVTVYLKRFSQKYNFPHINAHAFRHTMESMLYYNGVDTISISHRLGHAQPSTTANVYAHVIENSDKQNAEILSEAFLKNA